VSHASGESLELRLMFYAKLKCTPSFLVSSFMECWLLNGFGHSVMCRIEKRESLRSKSTRREKYRERASRENIERVPIV
jgi:hypothetical protein